MVRTHTLHGMFGVDPSTLETVYDAGTSTVVVVSFPVRTSRLSGLLINTMCDDRRLAGFDVPSILVEMKNYLLHQDAWQQEGIFRLAGEASDIKYLKQQMNKAKRLDVSTNPDINAIANLLKARTLSSPLLYNGEASADRGCA